jgi:hypothetical protein
MYEEEEIQALFKACDGDERVLYLCYLLTGLRDKEMRYLTWRDIDFRTQVIRVTRKPLYGFKPKNKEEREVPVPASLIAALKKYKVSKKPNADALVFPNESGRPDKRHEFKLKRIAFHAKMNCGQCTATSARKGLTARISFSTNSGTRLQRATCKITYATSKRCRTGWVRLFLRGSQTNTCVTCGLSRSCSQAAQVPSSKVTCKPTGRRNPKWPRRSLLDAHPAQYTCRHSWAAPCFR